MKKKISKKKIKSLVKTYFISVLVAATFVLVAIEIMSKGTISGVSLIPSGIAMLIFGGISFANLFREIILEIKTMEDDE